MTLRKEEQAGGAEILLASLTGAKRVSLLEAAGNFWVFLASSKTVAIPSACR